MTVQLDVSAELTRLKDMVMELRVAQTATQAGLECSKTQLDKMETGDTGRTWAISTERQVICCFLLRVKDCIVVFQVKNNMP